MVKTGGDQKSPDTANTKDDTKQQDSGTTNLNDSGISMHSLKQLIDDRVIIMINNELNKCGCKAEEDTRKQSGHLALKSAKEEANFDPIRERNIIIHGLDEGKVSDEDLVEELLSATETQHRPATIHRLGMKKTDTKRPLMLRMKTRGEKEECRNSGC